MWCLQVAVIGEPARSDAMASFASAFAQTGLKPGVVCPMYFLQEFGGVCARTHADPLPTLLTLDRQAFGSGKPSCLWRREARARAQNVFLLNVAGLRTVLWTEYEFDHFAFCHPDSRTLVRVLVFSIF